MNRIINYEFPSLLIDIQNLRQLLGLFIQSWNLYTLTEL